MKSLWLIFLIAACVLSLYSRMKGGAKRRVVVDDEAPVYAEKEMDMEAVESLSEGAYVQPSGGSHVENNYFSYEDSRVKPNPVKKVRIPAPASQEQTVLSPNFDLRQAVVYEAVLNNHYINPEN